MSKRLSKKGTLEKDSATGIFLLQNSSERLFCRTPGVVNSELAEESLTSTISEKGTYRKVQGNVSD